VPPFNEAIALLDNQRAAPVRAVLHAFEAYELAEADLQERLQRLLGIGPNDLVALRFIRSRELEGDPARPKDVEIRLRTSSAGATAITNRLKAAGLIDKPAHEHDRRARVLTLTPEGRERLTAALGDAPRAVDHLLAAVDVSDAARLASVLRALTQIVNTTGQGPAS
jgi:DNA-binding MarR family transcriptional regulator